MLMWSLANDILKRPVCTFLGEVQQSETSPSSHFTSHSENNGSLCSSAVSTKFMFLLLSVLSKVVPKYSTVECSCVPYSCHVREEGSRSAHPAFPQCKCRAKASISPCNHQRHHIRSTLTIFQTEGVARGTIS